MEKKDPKANPYLPTKETIIPKHDCQIPFVSLYPCGRPRKETAVLLCNWGLSITGFMHDFRWVTHSFPDVSCCFEASHCLAFARCICSDLFSVFFTERLVLIKWQECSVWDPLWFLTGLTPKTCMWLTPSRESDIDCGPFVTLISGNSTMGERHYAF